MEAERFAGNVELLTFDTETGEVSTMVWDGASFRPVHADEMFAGLVELGLVGPAEVGPAVNDPDPDRVIGVEDLSEFIARYEHAYPREA